MMKIASAKVAMTKMKADGIVPKTHEGYSSGKLPEQAIGKQDSYMTVYVAVDGGSDEFTDDAAAWFGITTGALFYAQFFLWAFNFFIAQS